MTFFSLIAGAANLRAQNAGTQLPDAPGKQVTEKLCSTCHTPALVLGKGRTHEEWSEVVASMISRGAKGTPGEFAQVVDYLAANVGPKAESGATTVPRRRTSNFGLSVGPTDKMVVDDQAVSRGKTLYTAECITCHGSRARGGTGGPDLVRSPIILHDRYGSTLGPFLRKGHTMQDGGNTSSLNEQQIKDLSNFLHQQLEDTLRSGPFTKVLNVLTGDPAAGKAYFYGPGGCSGCHSPTGDLKGIASKYDPPNLQQRFLFPRTIAFGRAGATPPNPVTVTVIAPGAAPVSGVLERMDDFDVSLRDAAGNYHSWTRTPDLKIEKKDPYAAHIALLDKYTDKDIHDVVAYLETLK